jgi:predicted transcriptional regulator
MNYKRNMAIDLSKMEQLMISELKISEDEAKVYIIIVKNGKMDHTRISSLLGWNDDQRAFASAKSLVERGMVIEIRNTEFESLHPRFAITNRYRRRCEEERIPFKRNTKIDNIGIVLEKPYDYARTK